MRTWESSIGVDALESGLLELCKLKPFRLVRETEFFEDDDDFGGIWSGICVAVNSVVDIPQAQQIYFSSRLLWASW